MSAETLRRAAALMRERAEVATPAPTLTRYDHGGGRLAVFDGPDRQLVADLYGNGGDREHYAAMTPAVALAVADWLDSWADWMGDATPHPGDRALAVARAYLGEQP